MKKMKSWGSVVFFCLLIWVGVIFYFSSQPGDISNDQSGKVVLIIKKIDDFFDITDTELYLKIESKVKNSWFFEEYNTPNAVVRKSAHFGSYFILGILCSSLAYFYSEKLLIGFLLGFCMPVTIAVMDEFYQGFTERHSTLTDVLIDGTGALAGASIVTIVIICFKLKS